MPTQNPPSLPAELTRPDAQMIVDALNLRLHTAETAKTALEAKVASLEAAAAIRGVVEAAGTVGAGSGFSVSKTATGKYTITLTTELATVGVFTVTAFSGGGSGPIIEEAGKKVFKVIIVNTSTFAAVDSKFNFEIGKS